MWYVHYPQRKVSCSHSTVSQFTLLAKTSKGTKPDFHGAANPVEASRLYHYFVQRVKDGYVGDRVKDGRFQAMMEVALVNDGPVRATKLLCHTAFLFPLVLGHTTAARARSCLHISGDT